MYYVDASIDIILFSGISANAPLMRIYLWLHLLYQFDGEEFFFLSIYIVNPGRVQILDSHLLIIKILL